MLDHIEVGSTPANEECAQVGARDYDYATRARRECRAFINQIERQFGPAPDGAKLIIKGSLHDYGTYYEVAVRFDSNNRKATEYAFLVEEGVSGHWDDEARKELGI